MDDERFGGEPAGGGPRRRSRRQVVGAGLVVVLLAAGAIAWWALREGTGTLTLPGLGPIASEKATLYFADARWTRLVPEQRRLAPTADAVARIRALVAALAEGPRGDGAPVLPEATKVRGVYLGHDGLAVVDLEDVPGLDFGGASGEALTVFSLVHTVVENVPGLASVQLLVGGRERETLAGHVKISEPLRPDPQWLGAAPAP
jgi:hypothetical protein